MKHVKYSRMPARAQAWQSLEFCSGGWCSIDQVPPRKPEMPCSSSTQFLDQTDQKNMSRSGLYFFPYWITSINFKLNLITLSWVEESDSAHAAVSKSHDIPYHAMHSQPSTPSPAGCTNETNCHHCLKQAKPKTSRDASYGTLLGTAVKSRSGYRETCRRLR